MTARARAAVLRPRQAFGLFEAGERLMRQNLHRRYPDETPEAIERRLTAWLMARPEADQVTPKAARGYFRAGGPRLYCLQRGSVLGKQ